MRCHDSYLTLNRSRDLFAEAVASYRSTLKDKDRAAFKAFQDPGAMLREVSMECKKHKDSSKLMKCCAKIASFSRMFEPYFEVVSIFVQVKPEYMGIIWGAIRFIFKVDYLSRVRYVAEESHSAWREPCSFS